MIIISGILIMVIVFGTVQLTCNLVDWINNKYNYDIDYSIAVLSVLLIELLVLMQILYNFKII